MLNKFWRNNITRYKIVGKALDCAINIVFTRHFSGTWLQLPLPPAR